MNSLERTAHLGPRVYTVALGPLDRVKNGLALRLRRKLFALFMQECAPSRDARVADFGVSAHRAHPVHYFFEALYPYPDRLTAIGREGAAWLRTSFPGVRYIQADLRVIPVPTGFFDCGICNAVLEHAGSEASQRDVVREVCRVCRCVMFTTPNRSFPIELHTFLPFLHWLPDARYRQILRALGLHTFASVETLNLLDRQTLLRLLPPDRDNRLFTVGLPWLPTNLVGISRAT